MEFSSYLRMFLNMKTKDVPNFTKVSIRIQKLASLRIKSGLRLPLHPLPYDGTT